MIEHRVTPRDGETACGDAVVIRTSEGGPTLIAIVDALGHGERAAQVATAAKELLMTAPLDAGVAPIIDLVHRGLRTTRGACALICLINKDRFEGCSVGNVEMRTSSGLPVPFVLTPGVLGVRLQNRTRIFSGKADRRARLVAYSDGISSRFHLDEFAEFSTADACRVIFERHRRSHDDATLLVADIEP